MNSFLIPQWSAPKHIQAFTSSRQGGVSTGTYEGFNLADHVGDNEDNVKENRTILKQVLKLPSDPCWIQQTHSTIAIEATSENIGKEADASFTKTPMQVCAVLTADCLPILVTNQEGTYVAAIHAGWRGLANGVIEETLKEYSHPEELLIWLGPGIGPNAFEVQDDVRDAFLKNHPEAEKAFTLQDNKKWLGNLYLLATQRLNKLGIKNISGGGLCTFSDSKKFFSARRDGIQTGRMVSVIWIE